MINIMFSIDHRLSFPSSFTVFRAKYCNQPREIFRNIFVFQHLVDNRMPFWELVSYVDLIQNLFILVKLNPQMS